MYFSSEPLRPVAHERLKASPQGANAPRRKPTQEEIDYWSHHHNEAFSTESVLHLLLTGFDAAIHETGFDGHVVREKSEINIGANFVGLIIAPGESPKDRATRLERSRWQDPEDTPRTGASTRVNMTLDQLAEILVVTPEEIRQGAPSLRRLNQGSSYETLTNDFAWIPNPLSGKAYRTLKRNESLYPVLTFSGAPAPFFG